MFLIKWDLLLVRCSTNCRHLHSLTELRANDHNVSHSYTRSFHFIIVLLSGIFSRYVSTPSRSYQKQLSWWTIWGFFSSPSKTNANEGKIYFVYIYFKCSLLMRSPRISIQVSDATRIIRVYSFDFWFWFWSQSTFYIKKTPAPKSNVM